MKFWQVVLVAVMVVVVLNIGSSMLTASLNVWNAQKIVTAINQYNNQHWNDDILSRAVENGVTDQFQLGRVVEKQLTCQTHYNGTAHPAGSFGPYLGAIPRNWRNGMRTISVSFEVEPHPDGRTGWLYCLKTGRVLPNDL